MMAERRRPTIAALSGVDAVEHENRHVLRLAGDLFAMASEVECLQGSETPAFPIPALNAEFA
mgnify:CR=1 FL=1